ncbi:DUF397 domain-containing protein [Streptomyces griseus]|uniref:DUF397 domain-containing protein n=1 Tax=Streptomyces griseus TaxID=1911 RepID=UPI000A420907
MEVADIFPAAVVPVRDSKVPHGPVLCFDADSWAAFIGATRRGLVREGPEGR